MRMVRCAVPVVAGMKPNVLGSEMFTFGVAKFGGLKALSASRRSCRLTDSLSGKSRKRLRSRFLNPGPRRLFRPALPKRAPFSGAHAQPDVQFTPRIVLEK